MPDKPPRSSFIPARPKLGNADSIPSWAYENAALGQTPRGAPPQSKAAQSAEAEQYWQSKNPYAMFDEDLFRRWYALHAGQWGLNPNPDDPRQFYDYRAAYMAGAAPDESGHWPSDFKLEGHPRMVVDGVNTKTGKKEK